MCYFIFYCIVFQYLYNLKLVPTTFHFTCTVAIKISYMCVSSFLMMSSVWRIISTLNHTCDFNQKSENWCESSSGWDKSLTKFSQGFPLNSIYFYLQAQNMMTAHSVPSNHLISVQLESGRVRSPVSSSESGSSTCLDHISSRSIQHVDISVDTNQLTQVFHNVVTEIPLVAAAGSDRSDNGHKY